MQFVDKNFSLNGSAQAGKEDTKVTEKCRNNETLGSSIAWMENKGISIFSMFSALFGGSVYRIYFQG
jgi:hypothetical protein